MVTHMTMASITLAACLLLGGCAGSGSTGHSAEFPDFGDFNDQLPVVTNDGFYDGGIFDQDMMDMEPSRPDR